mmetsp:Transcript_48420/g.122136  ORF Transcript_48420/g.122136 Transcript_48420/m.122136 type:complete len:358 (-) Transcript_48420:159-1232(-)
MGNAFCNANGCDETETELAGISTGADDPPLAGRWLSARGNLHVIGLDAVQWRSGDITKLKKTWTRHKGYEYATELNGTLYTAHMTPEGHLKWSDGDTWQRDTRGPETGTYAAVSDAFVRAGESFHSAFFTSTSGAEGKIDGEAAAKTDVEAAPRMMGSGTPAQKVEPQALTPEPQARTSDRILAASTPSRSPRPPQESSMFSAGGSPALLQYISSPTGWSSGNPYAPAESPYAAAHRGAATPGAESRGATPRGTEGGSGGNLGPTSPRTQLTYQTAGSPFTERGFGGGGDFAERSTPRTAWAAGGGGRFGMEGSGSPYDGAAVGGGAADGYGNMVLVPRPKRRIQSPKSTSSLLPDR